MSEPGREDRDQLWSEATLWFARMRSPEAEAFRPEFEQWLARGALHRRYYNRASEYWVDSGTALFEDHASTGSKTTKATEPQFRGRRGALAALVTACVVVAGSTVILFAPHRTVPGGPPAASPQAQIPLSQFATGAGDQRRVQLADRSVIQLASSTLLRVQLGSAIRRLDLVRGMARFEVAHETRPFVVFAGGGSVTARGTIFDVGLTPGRRVSVRLIRGSIDVRFPPARKARSQPPSRRLQPGESVSFAAISASQTQAAPAQVSGSASLTIPRDYRDVRLADIVDEANRHAAVPIRLSDPRTGAQKVSGRFRIDDSLLLAERLAALFDLQVDRSNPAVVVLRLK